MPEIKTVKLSEIIFDSNIYPRKEHDPTLVQRYAECMESIEAQSNLISLAEDLRLIDGRHRHLAYQTLFLDDPDHEIQVYIYPISSDANVFDLAAELNSDFGWQMTEDDKRATAIKMYQQFDRSQEDIAKRLKIAKSKVNGWLKSILEDERKEREAKIWDMWLRCYSQQVIANELNFDTGEISRFLQKNCVEFSGNDSQNFRNFEPQIYTTWNFSKSTNKVKHFGNIPPEIIDNLLYYYTKPFDVVFDPFVGGGMTIDVCKERKRRYYVSDLTPIPARPEIRRWDIAEGLPDDLPVPDLVFLDPPYWKQAEGKYSKKETDLGNMELEPFLDTIGAIAKNIKRKWNKSRPGARLALIIGPYKNEGENIDLSFLCYQAIVKYLTLQVRIQIPYSTEVHSGNYVKMAKKNKDLLYLSRDLMIFK